MAIIKTPVCGSCEVTATGAETVTIFSGTGDCYGSITFLNCSTESVDIIRNGNTASPITLSPGCRLAIARETLCSLAISFTTAADYIITYRGCICCNVECPCETSCD